MNFQNYLFVLCVAFPFMSFGQDLAVDHSLELIIDKDATTSNFKIDNNINLGNRSSMFVGRIESDYLQMKKIKESEGGQIMMVIYDDGMNDDENVIIKLTNEGSLPGALEYFSLQVFDDEFFLDEQYDGVVTSSNFGAYNQGDTFEIIRCEDAIIYRKNGMTIHVTELVDDDFIMHGEVIVTETEPTAGGGSAALTTDFRAKIRFMVL